MKAIKLFVFAAGILLMGCLNSCQSESKDFPVTIGFNNTSAVDSVFSGDSYNLKGNVVAEGSIQSVQFYRSYTFNNAQDSGFVEIAATKIVDIESGTCDFSINVPNISNTMTLKVVVTEKNGHMVSSLYNINIRPTNINFHRGITMGGWNSNFGSAADLDTGTPYGSSKLSTVGTIIDIFFDGGELASTDLDATVLYTSSYPGGARFADTGTRFAKTTFTAADFETYKADDSFKTMTGTLSILPIKVGDVVFFQTKGGKKGLLKVVSMTDPLGDLVLDELIQK